MQNSHQQRQQSKTLRIWKLSSNRKSQRFLFHWNFVEISQSSVLLQFQTGKESNICRKFRNSKILAGLQKIRNFLKFRKKNLSHIWDPQKIWKIPTLWFPEYFVRSAFFFFSPRSPTSEQFNLPATLVLLFSYSTSLLSIAFPSG